jgi:5-formaminoimidazole-4-carboxamide-1-(beta)-D-ribofuranosyl 5'-monophosphate synthetase
VTTTDGAAGQPLVATLGSHSALQILKGARDEGLPNLVVAAGDKANLYRRYRFVDEVVQIGRYADFAALEPDLAARQAVLVPHGSFVAYLGAATHDRLSLPYYGNRAVLAWEEDRVLQDRWLRHAGLHRPESFASPDEVDAWPVLAKEHGAPGGRGCFLAADAAQFAERLGARDPAEMMIQHYVVGVTLYIHYFQSIVDDRLEILSMDRRYETNVDGIGRLPASQQDALAVDPSYVVVGNSPLVLRESMLEEAYSMGERVVAASRDLVHPRGIWGPFCLETVITPDLKFHVIEISCRIVAGTNLFVDGSPYAALWFDEPMSTGRRLCRELRLAAATGRLEEVVDRGTGRAPPQPDP